MTNTAPTNVFKVTQGLFGLDFTDAHAILGVPIDAEFNDMRRRYMKIARRLHSDTCPFTNPADKDMANQLLSKLMTPAYKKLEKDADRAEYGLLLKSLGQRIVKEKDKLKWESEIAKKLAEATDVQAVYKAAIAELGEQQYEDINKSLEITGQISELNLVYLLRQGQKGSGSTSGKPAPTPAPAPVAHAPVTPPPAVATKATNNKDAFFEQNYTRAQDFIKSKNYGKAILELKEAVKRQPASDRAHGLLGVCYLQQNQATMAKIHIKKALELNPQEANALEAKKTLDKSAVSTAKGKGGGKSHGKGDHKGKNDENNSSSEIMNLLRKVFGDSVFGISLVGKKDDKNKDNKGKGGKKTK